MPRLSFQQLKQLLGQYTGVSQAPAGVQAPVPQPQHQPWPIAPGRIAMSSTTYFGSGVYGFQLMEEYERMQAGQCNENHLSDEEVRDYEVLKEFREKLIALELRDEDLEMLAQLKLAELTLSDIMALKAFKEKL